MKRLLITILICICITSCNTEDDCHEVLINTVFLSVKASETNGINLFKNDNFDISLLKIVSLNNGEEIEFSTAELLGENIIQFEFVGDIIFNYNNENKVDLKFSNTESELNDCGAITSFSFTAESNNQILCECDSNDVINIEFDI